MPLLRSGILAALLCAASLPGQEGRPRPKKSVEVFVTVRKPGEWKPRRSEDDGKGEADAGDETKEPRREGRRLEGREVVYRFDGKSHDTLEGLRSGMRKFRNDSANWLELGDGTAGLPVLQIRGDLQMRVRDVADLLELGMLSGFVYVEPDGFRDTKLWLATGKPGGHRAAVLPLAKYAVHGDPETADLVYALSDNRYESREGLVTNLSEGGGTTKVIEHFRKRFAELEEAKGVVSVPTPKGAVQMAVDPVMFHADQWCYWGSVAAVMRVAKDHGFRNFALATARTDGDAKKESAAGRGSGKR